MSRVQVVPLEDLEQQEVVTLEDLAGHAVVSVPIAARLLNIGRSAGYRAVEAGQIPAIRVGRRFRVPVAGLRALLAADGGDGAVGARDGGR